MERNLLFALFLLGLLAVTFGRVSEFARKNVRIVENGTHIINDGTKLTFQEPSGKITAHELPENLNVPKKRDSGWVTSYWSFGTNFTEIYGTWTVPPNPTDNVGQILFFFNSLENSAGTEIIQPVLQFQNGVSGWTLASWYVIGDTSAETTPFPVNVGDTITGWILLSDGIWYIYGYVNGQLVAELTVSSSTIGVQPTAQAIVLEAYSPSACDQYPPTGSLTVSSVSLYDGGVQVPSPTWQTEIYPNSCSASGFETSPSEVTITWLV